MTAIPIVIVGAYLAFVLVQFVQDAERMHRHPGGIAGFVADLALLNAWLFLFAAGAGLALMFARPFEGLLGWVVPNLAGLALAVPFWLLPPVRRARKRVEVLQKKAFS